MFHIELRQFPHNLCHFNLDDGALGAIVKAWTSEPFVEIEGRKWNPHQATLKILEGPAIPLDQLTMGRGWRVAERQGKDVGERVLTAAKEAAGAPSGSSSQPALLDRALEADSLGLELLSMLADGPAPLYYAWRLAAKRFPDRSPGECLMLAESAVGSLVKSRLIVLLHPADTEPSGHSDPNSDGAQVTDAELEAVHRAHEIWAPPGSSTSIRMRRA